MRPRPTTPVFAALAVLGLGWAAAGLHLAVRAAPEVARLSREAALVGRLGLTDLALFTEARFARHPSQADLHTAFQDHPLSLDHFPAGSLAPRPAAGFGSGARP